VADLFTTIDLVAAEARRRVSGGELLATLRQSVERRPVSVAGRPLTIQSALQIGVGPPSFALRVSRPAGIHFSYERYLVKSLRRVFGFTGSPIRLSFRQATHPRKRTQRAKR
jgi:GTP-binding protein